MPSKAQIMTSLVTIAILAVLLRWDKTRSFIIGG